MYISERSLHQRPIWPKGPVCAVNIQRRVLNHLAVAVKIVPLPIYLNPSGLILPVYDAVPALSHLIPPIGVRESAVVCKRVFDGHIARDSVYLAAVRALPDGSVGVLVGGSVAGIPDVVGLSGLIL